MRRVPLYVTLLAAGCTEYEYTIDHQVDIFQQNRLNAVDLLVVVDNSCSMVEEQDNLAVNFDALIDVFTTAEVDWQLAVTTTDTEDERFRGLLLGGDDEVVIRSPEGGEIDRVGYTRDWPFDDGVSLALDGSLYGEDDFSTADNDDVANWCAVADEYAAGETGSPGQWNAGCAGTASPPSGGTDDGPVAPSVGAVLVTEIHARAAGDDAACEWVEITNVTDDTVDLSGYELADNGRNSVFFPDGTLVAPYDALVVGRSTDTAENCGAPVDVAFSEGFTLNDDVRVLTPETEAVDELFSELVAQGTTGTGIEMGLEAARLTFEEPYYTTANGAWLRDEARLSLLFLSDEEDSSPYDVDSYLRYFLGLKGDLGYRDRTLVNLSGVVGKDPPPADGEPSCVSDDGHAWYGKRYIAAANETNGLVESICEDDYAPIVEKLGLTITGLSLDFALSEVPRIETLVVAVYEDPEGQVKHADLVRDVDYIYVSETNTIHFDEDQVPPSEYYIVAEYDVAATEAGGNAEGTE